MKKSIVFISLIGFLLDRLTKYFVLSKMILHSRIEIIKNFFYINYVKNDGAAWSILKGNRIFLISITVLALGFIVVSIINQKKISKIDVLAYGVIIGGILGNLFDRIVYKYVVDFLDFYIFNYNFPVFNIADSLIVIGVLLMGLSIIKGEKNENNSK